MLFPFKFTATEAVTDVKAQARMSINRPRTKIYQVYNAVQLG